MPEPITVLALSVVLLFVHIALQGRFVTRERGLTWNAGPRDEDQPPLGKLAGRAQRALDNYKETYPAFVGLALALVAVGRADGLGATGAWLWLAARVVYVPLYMFGVPWLRTAVFGVSVAGLILMLSRLF